MKKFAQSFAALSVAVSTAVLFAPVQSVWADIGASTTASPNSASKSFDSVLPVGTTVGLTKMFKLDNQEVAVVTTKGSAKEDRPWIIVAKQSASGAWVPVSYLQTATSWQADSIVLGPRHGQKQSMAVAFVVDAATGIMHNVYTLDVSTKGMDVVKTLQDVVQLQPIESSSTGFQINAFNLQVVERLVGEKWSVQSTPTQQLLSGSAVQVGFLMGQAPVKGKDEDKIYLVGKPTIYVRAGHSLSFIPLNTEAQHHLLGAYENLGSMQGISVYAAVPGSGELQFYQAAQVMSNQYKFSSPGTYRFAIVPPGYTGMKPDATCAIVTVKVHQ